MNFNKTLFRCSGLGYLMTDPKSKEDKEAGNLSESTKTHLVDVYVSAKYKRNTEITSKYLDKGNLCEEDSITLYSRVKKQFFKKNDKHLKNEYLMGTPDLFTGIEISEADKIIDTKTSWDIFTFFRAKSKPLDKMYYWQVQGYMALTGARKATVAFCLVNTPQLLIEAEKRKLLYSHTDDDVMYQKAIEELDRLLIYDDIPMEERVFEFDVARNESDIKKLYQRIERAREFLNEMERSYSTEMVA